MTTDVVDEFVKYLGERHFNAASLLSKLNSAPRRNGEKTLRDLWEASDLSANDFAEEVARFYRLPRAGLPQLIAAPTLAPKFSRRFLRETLVFPYAAADGSCRLVLADPTDVAVMASRGPQGGCHAGKFGGRVSPGSLIWSRSCHRRAITGGDRPARTVTPKRL